MKTLNKTLSLVLVLVMVLGIFGIAGAAFTDQNDIKHTEAVEVMTGIGAINGYTDGSVRPTGSITREEAAKLVTYSILGKDVADKLSVTNTGFKDVDAGRWSAPYISYLVSRGIINGMGDNTFAPEEKVTAYQIAKMMLCAAGYGAKGEFLGNGWELAVAVEANKAGVFDNVSGVDFTKPATREQAMLYAFNGLVKTPVVKYNKLYEAYYKVENTTSLINSDNVLQLAEEVYPKLACNTTPVNGVSGRTWVLNGTTISAFYSDASVLSTITDGTKISEVSTKTNIKYVAEKASTVEYYFNGSAVAAFDAAKSYSEGDLVVYENLVYATKAGGHSAGAWNADNFVEYSAKGAIVTLYAGTGADSKKISNVGITEKEVLKLAAAPVIKTVGSKTTVSISGINGGNAMDSTKVSYPADLAKGDVVLFYKDDEGMTRIEKATKLSGNKIESYTATTVTIDGKKYAASELGGTNKSFSDLQGLLGASGYTFYIDNGSNICYTVEPDVTASLSNAVLVTGTDSKTEFGKTTYLAQLAKMDGTREIVTVSKTADYNTDMTTVSSSNAGVKTAGNLGSGVFYMPSKNADGTYNLRAAQYQEIAGTSIAGSAIAAGDFTHTITPKTAKFITKYVVDTAPAAAEDALNWSASDITFESPVTELSYMGTNSTVFMYYDEATKTTTVKTGISNAMSFGKGGNISVLADENGYALAVFASGAPTKVASSDYNQVFVTSPASVSKNENNVNVYTYSAVINGEKDKTISSYSALNLGELYFINQYDKNGVVIADSALTSSAISAATSYGTLLDLVYASGVLSIDAANDAHIILDKDVAIYVLDNRVPSAPAVNVVTPEQAAALTYGTAGDTIHTVVKSATDSSVAAIYIYMA